MGHMKDLDRRIRQGGDDAIAAVSELMDSKIHEDVVRELRPWLAQRRWIPVTERLPPLMTEVLGWHPSDRVRAWFRHSGMTAGGVRARTYWEQWSPQDRECDDCEVDCPTHWMVLPEPPEVK